MKPHRRGADQHHAPQTPGDIRGPPGCSRSDEVSTLLDHVPAAAVIVTVAMSTSFETALVRAQADLTRTRGMSRDRSWLSDRYNEWSTEMSRISADVLLDARALSVDQGVSLISAAIESARTSPT